MPRRPSVTSSAHDLSVDSPTSTHSGISLPAGRSYIAFSHAGASYKDDSFTSTDFDIREGSVRLGSLALAERARDKRVVTAPSLSPIPSSSALLQPESSTSSNRSTSITPRNAPSALSQLIQQRGTSLDRQSTTSQSPETELEAEGTKTPKAGQASPPSVSVEHATPDLQVITEDHEIESEGRVTPKAQENLALTEQTPLLPRKESAKVMSDSDKQEKVYSENRIVQYFQTRFDQLKKETKDLDYKDIWREPVRLIPAVILGILLNLLDGVSYGLIMFPTTPIFNDFGGIGVSMFFVSCIISQIIYSSRSIFKAGNGSMMIEIVPFLHSMTYQVSSIIGYDQPRRVIATVMLAFAMSAILTGLVFLGLGVLRVGYLLEFFPRHILVGCIGGIGAFLVVTGLQVTARLDESSDLQWTMETLKFFIQPNTLPLWTIPLALAIVLRIMTVYLHHPLVIPSYFIIVGAIFYLVAVVIIGRSVEDLRDGGWIFNLGNVDNKWYEFYTEFDFRNTDWEALFATMPTQLALVFFALLHVPLNLPALALSIKEDNLDADRELVNHGLSNFVAGLFGTIPNYLCYTNSVLFYRVGGTTRFSGFLLSFVTLLVLLAGPSVISYLPVMVVGALIYILGLDLLKEAVSDTIGRVSKFEYFTIWVIIIVMTFVDFVAGVAVGILVACCSFVVTSSRRAAIRQVLNGSVAKSTVRRHPLQSQFLREVGSQIRVIKLQGQIFFGTASQCESTIRSMLDIAQWKEKPIRYLVLDFLLVNGVDFSAAEAFLRVQRLCEGQGVVLILCGCLPNSASGKALRAVELWAGNPELRVEVFENLNAALEHCENSLLRSLYASDLAPPAVSAISEAPLVGIGGSAATPPTPFHEDLSSKFAHSPRRRHLYEAAKDTMGLGMHKVEKDETKIQLTQPLQLLVSSLSTFSPEVKDHTSFFHAITRYFIRMHVEEGTVLWNAGDEAINFYLIETGVLRAASDLEDYGHSFVETMLPASICGVMPFLSGSKRQTKLVVERDAVLWRMSRDSYEKLEAELPIETTRQLRKIWLRIVEAQQDLLLGYLITSL